MSGPAVQVKQYVSVVANCRGRRFMVFKTGNDKFYLFCALDDQGFQTGLQFPVEKKRLRREFSSALRHGWGNASI